jgi:hypothetical protein
VLGNKDGMKINPEIGTYIGSFNRSAVIKSSHTCSGSVLWFHCGGQGFLNWIDNVMETRTVKPRNQLPNTLLPLMPMVVIIDRLCHVHQDLGELFGYFYNRLSRL